VNNSLPLRDIHLPEPVSWWPPGPGWWILLCCLLAVIGLFLFLRHRYRQRALSRAALAELNHIERHFREHADPGRLARDLSELLRRTGISLQGRRSIAALSGEQWLAWLDRQANTDQFSHGPGRHLLSAPYQPKPDFSSDDLLELCRHWLQTVPLRRKKERPS
jgi:hypothetical protein